MLLASLHRCLVGLSELSLNSWWKNTTIRIFILLSLIFKCEIFARVIFLYVELVMKHFLCLQSNIFFLSRPPWGLTRGEKVSWFQSYVSSFGKRLFSTLLSSPLFQFPLGNQRLSFPGAVQSLNFPDTPFSDSNNNNQHSICYKLMYVGDFANWRGIGGFACGYCNINLLIQRIYFMGNFIWL